MMWFKKRELPCLSQRQELKNTRDTIIGQIKSAKITAMMQDSNDVDSVFKEQTFEMLANKWVEYSQFNVQAILCSLNNKHNDLTVINCKFEVGGYIPPLKHDREKMIYVIDGSFTNTVTNETYQRGGVCKLAPHELHSIKSDDALLTITWKPAY